MIVNNEEMRELERMAKEDYGLDERLIIENVGIRGSSFLLDRVLDKQEPVEILMLVGRGKNGSDGVAIARHLSCVGLRPRLFMLFRQDELSEELSHQLKLAKSYGAIVNFIENTQQVEEFFDHSQRDILVIDAIFGTGVIFPLSNFLCDVIQISNQKAAMIVSIDVPTGIDADTGEVKGTSIQADLTLCVGPPKVGLFLGEGAQLVGKIEVLEVGFPHAMEKQGDKFLLDYDAISESAPVRNKFADKNMFGHTLILGGSHGLTGALIMASQAAMRVGAGLITAATWEPQYQEFLSRLGPEIMTGYLPIDTNKWPNLIKGLNKYSAIVIGPGLARSARARRLVIEILNNFDGPVVLDADAINVLKIDEDMSAFNMRSAPTVMTPHLGEFARFTGIPYETIAQEPLKHLKSVIDQVNCAIVLKGPCTFVGLPDGKTFFNFRPNDGMAKGGVGDILAGLMGGLLAQHLELKETNRPLVQRYDVLASTVKLAVYIHALAGQYAVKDFGVRAMTSTSLLDVLPQVFAQLRSKLDSFQIPGELDA